MTGARLEATTAEGGPRPDRIVTHLWFDGDAEAAVKLYTSVFGNSKVGATTRYGEAGAGAVGQKPGSVMTVEFELNGQRFVALNGGPMYRFTPAVSFAVMCHTQAELDHYWSRLSEAGQEQPCGWLRDRFGLSWQVLPAGLPEMMTDPDPARAGRVMAALLKMHKIDIAALERARQGE